MSLTGAGTVHRTRPIAPASTSSTTGAGSRTRFDSRVSRGPRLPTSWRSRGAGSATIRGRLRCPGTVRRRRPALRHQREHLPLARREVVERTLRAPRAHEPGDDRGVHDAFALADALEGVD